MPHAPYAGQISGYDQFGRPIFRPISPYDETPAHYEHPGEITRPYSYQGADHHEGPLGHTPVDPDAPRTLGLLPHYAQVTDPYSELGMGFPMQ